MTKNSYTLSTNKIITLVVFVCCALMTSLFVFHTTHKQPLTVVADGNATLFPVGRDIKPFEFYSTNKEKFTEKDFLDHWSLVFFGFTHCQTICPTTFEMLGQAYKQLHADFPNLQVVLVSIDPTRDNPDALTHFTHSFSPDFIGITGKIQDVRKLQSQLGIYSARDEASNSANYQLQHSTSILLIDPKGKWTGLFKSGINADDFVAAFKASMKTHA